MSDDSTPQGEGTSDDSAPQGEGTGDRPSKLMTFTEHLEELRSRLKACVIALLIATVVAYFFADLLFALLAQPLAAAWNAAGWDTPSLHFANPVEPFFTYVKLALLAGIFVACPVVFYQLWMFVAPGLTGTERRYVIPFVLASTICFVGGAGFGYFVVFPYAFRFLLGFAKGSLGTIHQIAGRTVSVTVGQPIKLQPTLMMGEYFALVWRLLLAFGVVFELPLLLVFLAMAGLVTHRTLWKWNPYFAVLAFVLAAFLTPPDVVTQLFMAGPLIALYNLSIVFAWVFTRRREKKTAS